MKTKNRATNRRRESAARFSHAPHFTGYMQVVADSVRSRVPAAGRILDMPAGNGLLGDRLREMGYDVTQADLNEERPDFVSADMEGLLPFPDDSFDAVLCLEGIEHILNQRQLLAEIVRVTRPRGWIMISTPNVSNLLSRLSFLFAGHFYQFDPRYFGHAEPGTMLDKGHISPMSVYELAYTMSASGARLLETRGDRLKKKALLPLALMLWPVVVCNERRIERMLDARMRDAEAPAEGVFFHWRVYLSRSLIAIFRKG